MRASQKPTELSYQGVLIGVDRKKMVSLTDMWKAVEKPKHKDPAQWLRLPTTSVLIRFLESNMGLSHVCKTVSGNKGGTWAIPNLAVAYAEYLSPAFHAWATEAILQQIDRDVQPRDVTVQKWHTRGKTSAWIQERLVGILVRNEFTDALQDHGVEDFGYGACTNAIYKPVLGGSAKEVKIDRGLGPRDNLREHLSADELSEVSFTESLARRQIENRDLHGNEPCKAACELSGIAVRALVDKVEQVDLDPKRRIGYEQRPAKRIDAPDQQVG